MDLPSRLFCCRYANCTFNSKKRRDVVIHYVKSHKEAQIACKDPDCPLKFAITKDMKKHYNAVHKAKRKRNKTKPTIV